MNKKSSKTGLYEISAKERPERVIFMTMSSNQFHQRGQDISEDCGQESWEKVSNNIGDWSVNQALGLLPISGLHGHLLSMSYIW